ncbi:helix-turn-helix transcriptional regulator [Arenibacter sp. GZD96]|uniref:helix-turn-helix domain-containing protein n=1 Tax=Aurantibrevibacter litoralis TaxID=3106030 RepID=UPI002AFE5F32|nr:helix-turn-helix transcriptional regulator [Arenibacter sp. GZD-96]MEA1787312.1 helix-turn-helix transcriptional regulator [Arenibacter sp. GZD-96]
MKTIKISGYDLATNLSQLTTFLGGNVVAKSTEATLDFDCHEVQGKAKGYQLGNGMSYLELEINTKEDLMIVQHHEDENIVNFIYISTGFITHSFDLKEGKIKLKKLQPILIKNSGTANHFQLKSHVLHTISIIRVPMESVTHPESGFSYYHVLKDALDQFYLSTHTVYLASHNLKVLTKIQELRDLRSQGIAKWLFVEGIINTVLGMFIEQLEEDLEGAEKRTGLLTKKEMKIIQEMSTSIKNYPDVPYTLKFLNAKTGISPSKLQEGFKLLHNRTVTDYIRNIRVETGEHLIKTTEMNISEIVYSIGLTSRSYFSKIFKEKYNCSPKYYQEHQNTFAGTL